ncbi:MAG: hypothetical protein V3V28_01525 [Polaribacter sp.]|uniref:HD domain-containing protein n=1 Tax=Polaribacter sp. TaxID=1920175 RepID=UPI002F35F42F
MDIKELYKDWIELAEKYCQDLSVLNTISIKIKKKYSERNRHYHNLQHIDTMLKLAKENASEIKDLDEVLFAIWFHDIIYKSRSKKNEEKSAKYLKKLLRKSKFKGLNNDKIDQLIMATKKHQIIVDTDLDNAFLLDFDLSILGKNWDVYQEYTQQIRKEYRMFPNFLYIPARKKVLQGFLNREKLFFTEKYQELFEEQARRNLQKELDLFS